MMGALLALGLLAGAYSYLHDQAHQVLPFLELMPPTLGLFWDQSPVVVGVGIGLGLAGSFLAMRKYLHV
jgi:cell division protein FtsX